MTLKILVVDDSAVMRKLVIRTLRQAGYGDADVAEAGDGVEALAAVADDMPSLVLSDWNMPNMDGLELVTALREQGVAVPFGFVTSESSAELKAKASVAGASFLLSKPFTADDLGNALSELV